MKKYLLLVTILIYSINNLYSQTVIQMEKQNGVFMIPCEVNGIPMKFIFDTGASNVMISKTEAEFLIKQGLLTKEDFFEKVNYQIADGSVQEGIEVNLKEIKIEDLILKDIKATIIKNSNSPLLLGQSALSKLGKIEINQNRLIIYPINERNNYEFLGIDLTKNIEDFGLSRINVVDADPLVPIRFKDLEISEDHFLKKFEFNKQLVLFDQNGEIDVIMLKLITKEKNLIDQDGYAKEKFNEIAEELDQTYWISEDKMTRNIEWKSKYFIINLMRNSDNSLVLVYIPKIINDVKNEIFEPDKKKYKKQGKETQKETLENLRIEFAETITEQQKQFPVEGMTVVSYTKNGKLIINFDLEMKIKPSIYRQINNKAINDSEQNMSQSLSFTVLKMSLEDKEIVDFACELFDGITFEFIFRYNINTKNELIKSISANNLKRLNYPFIKSQFERILK